MELVRENQLELAIASPTLSFQDLLDSQKELFTSQVDQLQNIVLTQCKLTGVNPLSQEMAAGALSIKIGKRPRDLLNPKAIKYMQSVFSIKDAISKRESREISARFAVTVTQVREFFTTQRSRVRKFVRLSREKALRSSACKEVLEGVPVGSDPDIPIDPVPLNSVDPANVEQGSSCSTHDEVISGINDSDKYFLDNIFSMMRKEETFSGQVKLLEWILQIRNASVLYCFLTKGGVMILATWLSQAAAEEQTSVLHAILKVLCHLPLGKALPAHMSAILQSVNRLRFYRASDISNRARILLSRWSKAFARSQALKKPNAMKSFSDAHDEMLLKQSIGEVMSSELWESNADFTESPNLPIESSENHRKLETLQPMKLLTASSDDSDRKFIRGASSSKIRERRKVLLVEQPGQKTAGRSPQASRSVPAIQGRPLSADDIQKAKMRAQFMQNKYGKSSTPPEENIQVKSECLPKRNSSPAGIIISRPKIEELRKPVKLPSVPSYKPERHLDSKTGLDPGQPLVEKDKWFQIPWQSPPEITISGAWSVGTGDNSKEVEVQKNRMYREKEIIYKTVQEIPANPREPWDREIDYDDTLTPEIPTEQLPDADGTETGVSPSEIQHLEETPAPLSQNGNVQLPEPDLELLAVLLKNPELVLALTSGKAGGMSSEETVKLLDMIKAQGASSLYSMSGLGRKAEEKVEVCLPSPTPSTDPVTSGWRQEFAKNPFSRQNPVDTGGTHDTTGVVTAGLAQEKGIGGSLAKPQIPTATFLAPEHLGSLPQLSQPTVAQFPLSHSARVMIERHPPLIPSLQPHVPTNSLNVQGPLVGLMSNMNPRSVSSMAMPNLLAATSPPSRLNYATPPSPSLEKSVPEGLAARMSLTAQTPPQPLAPLQPRLAEAHNSNQTWIARQGLALNSPYQANQNNYNSLVGQTKAGPSWDRNEFMGGPELESWSPENSPLRSDYMPGMNYAEPMVNLDRSLRPERSRPWNPPGNRLDHGRDANRRWRDRRRE